MCSCTSTIRRRRRRRRRTKQQWISNSFLIFLIVIICNTSVFQKNNNSERFATDCNRSDGVDGSSSFIFASAAKVLENHDEETPFTIAGYLPEYKAHNTNVNNTVPYLTDLILFSVSPHSLGFVGGCCLDPSHYEIIHQAKAYKHEWTKQSKQITFETPGGNDYAHDHHYNVLNTNATTQETDNNNDNNNNNDELRLWVSVGGADHRSDNFASVAANPTKRERFIKSLVNLCIKQNIDGIDFNWEFPKDMDQYKLYCILILEASVSLKRHNILISVATRNMFPPEVMDVVDRFHLMTYDLRNLDKHTKKSNDGTNTALSSTHHADFHKVQGYVNEWINSGCPPSKIVLGIPMYARHLDRNEDVMPFNEIIDKQYYTADDTQDIIDEELMLPKELRRTLLTKSNKNDIENNIKMVSDDNSNSNNKDSSSSSSGGGAVWNGYMYDSPLQIRQKVNYAKEKKLGGIFFWELGQDKQVSSIGSSGGILLEAAFDEASMIIWDASSRSTTTKTTTNNNKKRTTTTTSRGDEL